MNKSEDIYTTKEISLSELKQAIDLIFEHIQNDLKLDRISLDHDYYADISLEDKFELLSKTKDTSLLDNIEPGLGQLYDDWEFLQSMIKEDTAVALMLEHVAPILRYIAYKGQEQHSGKNDG